MIVVHPHSNLIGMAYRVLSKCDMLTSIFLFIHIASADTHSQCPAEYKPYRSQQLSDYKSIGRPCRWKGAPHVAIRSFSQNGARKLLVVNEATLDTQIVLEKDCASYDRPRSLSSNFFQALDTYLNKETGGRRFTFGSTYTEANQGFSSFSNSSKGCENKVVLSTDLCPTNNGVFQKNFYSRLANAGLKGKPVTVVIPVSGMWLENHRADFEWLKNLKGLNIVWANHSETHGLFPKQGRGEYYPTSFLPGASCGGFWNEVASVEMRLIDLGVKPSIFMRYPGLVSSVEEKQQLRQFGLISLATNAWPALQGDPTNDYNRIFKVTDPSLPTRAGSILLGHGNRDLDSHLLERELHNHSELSTISPNDAVICDLKRWQFSPAQSGAMR